jgi:hypothetical protein
MKRVLAVVFVAALTTMMLGSDRTSWAGQAGDARKAEKQRADVMKVLKDMRRGSTVSIELKAGEKFDAVIQEIAADTLTIMREQGDTVSTQSVAIGDIARLKKTNIRKMGVASKVLIGTAVALGVLVAACRSSASATQAPPMAQDAVPAP